MESVEDMVMELNDLLESGGDTFSEWEEGFITNMVDWVADEKPITAKQRESVQSLYERKIG